jgi:hypothetical protein
MKTYTHNSMKVSLAGVMAAGLLTAGQSIAAQAGVAVGTLPPAVDSVPESGAVIRDNGEYVTVSFPGSLGGVPSAPPAGAAATIRTSLMTSEGVFTGDYIAAGVQGISFSLMHTGTRPPRAAVVLVSASGVAWYNKALLKFNEAEGVWQANNISLDLRAGWRNLQGSQNEETWHAALRNVQAVGLDLVQLGSFSQTASVDHFRLLLDNEVETPDAVLSERLFARFGVRDRRELTDAQRKQDSDGNGIADYLEIWVTQSDPDSDEGDLMVEVSRTPQGKSEVSWTSVAGGEYAVEVSDSPRGQYRALVGAERVRATVKGRTTKVDNEDGSGGLRFYRVKQFK